MENNSFGNITVILAAIVAVIALVIGIAAYNRAGVDIDQVVEENVQEALNDIEETGEDVGQEIEQEIGELSSDDFTYLEEARASALESLRDIRTRLNDGETYEDIQNELEETRNDLNDTYSDLGITNTQTYMDLNNQFEITQTALEANQQEGLDSINELIDEISNNIVQDQS